MKNKIYYKSQTEAALRNFPFPTHSVHLELIYSIAEVKKATAKAHQKAGELDITLATAIVQAAEEIINGMHDEQFVTCSIQGGAGTSIHMNVNEVIATRATEICGISVHANDHVNMGQSTNDVNPSALKITCIRLTHQVLKSLDYLINAFDDKAKAYKTVRKIGRTHLQDAVPTTFGAECKSYRDILERNKKRLNETLLYLYDLNLGGTAVGNSINASPAYIRYVYPELQKITKLPVKKAHNLMSQTSSSADFCHLSSTINILFTDINKIANDLRFLASGPYGGIGEISLKELQKGSSIMPGKVNPIIPEAMNQLSYDIMGKNLTIHQAATNSYLELSLMFPVMADAIISMLKITASGLFVFGLSCIEPLKPNREHCEELLEHSTTYATLFSPTLGYDTVSNIVKEVVQEHTSFRQAVLKKELLTEKSFEKITHKKLM